MERERRYCGFAIERRKEENQKNLKEYSMKLECFKKEKTQILERIENENQQDIPNEINLKKYHEILDALEKEILHIESFIESLKKDI